MKKHCRCGDIIHPVRKKLGNNSSVQCSNTKKVSYIHIIANNQIQKE